MIPPKIQEVNLKIFLGLVGLSGIDPSASVVNNTKFSSTIPYPIGTPSIDIIFSPSSS